MAITPTLCSSSNASLAARAVRAGRPTRDAASCVSGERAGSLAAAARCRAPRGAAMLVLTPPLVGSQGSVEVQSTLVFGHGNGTVTSDAVEQQLRNSLDRNGSIMDLRLASIRSEQGVGLGARAPRAAPGSAAPSWLGQGGSLAVQPARGVQPAEPAQFPGARGGQRWQEQLDREEPGSSPRAASQRSRGCLSQPAPGPAQQRPRGSGPLSGSTEAMAPAPAPVVPDWAIALLVLVCILLLLSILTCLLMVRLLSPAPSPPAFCRWVACPRARAARPQPFPLPPQTTCTCRRKSRGKLDLLSTKDSYHPMAEYAPYQSHGRYVSPSSKPNPYSQVRAERHHAQGCSRPAPRALRGRWAAPFTAGLMANGAGGARDGRPGEPPHARPLPAGR